MNNDMNTDYDDSQMCCGHSGVCSDCDMYDMTMPQEYDPCECFMPADLCLTGLPRPMYGPSPTAGPFPLRRAGRRQNHFSRSGLANTSVGKGRLIWHE